MIFYFWFFTHQNQGPSGGPSWPGWPLRTAALFLSLCSDVFSCGAAPGDAFQIQCFQCEEMKLDCSAPEHVVNCTVNVQDMCQKEVLVRADGQSTLASVTFASSVGRLCHVAVATAP